MNFTSRIKTLQSSLKKNNCDVLIIDDPVNLYYLTGMELSLGTLFIAKESAYLLVDGRYFEACQKSSPVTVILSDPSQKSLAKLLQDYGKQVVRVGFNSDITSYKAFQDLNAFIKTVDDSKTFELVPVSSPVRSLRAIKDKEEIDLLRQAGVLGSEGFDFVCTLLKEGISESEIAVELEIFWKRRGSKSLAFDPIIAFGVNSSMPHYRAGNRCLQKGDCVLIDIGVNIRHYHSDMTRCVFFGKPDPRLAEIYAVVRDAQKKALDLCKPGTLIGDLDRVARDWITSKGFGEQFTHSLGHGVGLEIHEWPTVRSTGPSHDVPLEAGMVITIEPGVYLPNIGGIRIEDTVVITPNGHENLTNRPTELLVL